MSAGIGAAVGECLEYDRLVFARYLRIETPLVGSSGTAADCPRIERIWVANVASTSEYVSRDRTFSTEQIFALNINNLPDRMDGYMIEGENAFQGANGNILGINGDCFDESSRAMDPRYAYLHTTYSYYGTEFLISNKYYKDNDYNNSYSPWSANRLPLIRVSEMYYIAAECEPNLSTAIGYLEAVRQNRGLSAFPLTCSSKEELQHEIEMEYRLSRYSPWMT